MPYIKEEDRPELREAAKIIAEHLQSSKAMAGEFNFFISTIIAELLKEPSYRQINEIIGVLECAKLEAYRRVAGPYEDTKATVNGDVYYPLVK